MKSKQTRVIKSEEVSYINTSSKALSGRSHRDDMVSPSVLENLKETYAQKIQAAEQKSYAKGLSEGILEGRELQKKEMLDTTQALNALIREISGLKSHVLETAEEQMLELALEIAEKVIHMETTTNREVVQNVLKAAIKNIVDRENMKIRLHPQDYQYMMEIKPDFLRGFDGVKNIVFEQDASIVRGGAYIETMFGEVDARLDHQYNQIKSSLTTATRSG